MTEIISRFQWIKKIDVNRHYDYNVIPKEDPPYTPFTKGQESGFQWIKPSDENFQYQVALPSKTIFMINDQYKIFDENGWRVISNSFPSLLEFQDEGMDNLKAFIRRVQYLPGSVKMGDNGLLGAGKVFKTNIDLKKYFDLRGLEVNTIE